MSRLFVNRGIHVVSGHLCPALWPGGVQPQPAPSAFTQDAPCRAELSMHNTRSWCTVSPAEHCYTATVAMQPQLLGAHHRPAITTVQGRFSNVFAGKHYCLASRSALGRATPLPDVTGAIIITAAPAQYSGGGSYLLLRCCSSLGSVA